MSKRKGVQNIKIKKKDKEKGQNKNEIKEEWEWKKEKIEHRAKEVMMDKEEKQHEWSETNRESVRIEAE